MYCAAMLYITLSIKFMYNDTLYMYNVVIPKDLSIIMHKLHDFAEKSSKISEILNFLFHFTGGGLLINVYFGGWDFSVRNSVLNRAQSIKFYFRFPQKVHFFRIFFLENAHKTCVT